MFNSSKSSLLSLVILHVLSLTRDHWSVKYLSLNIGTSRSLLSYLSRFLKYMPLSSILLMGNSNCLSCITSWLLFTRSRVICCSTNFTCNWTIVQWSSASRKKTYKSQTWDKIKRNPLCVWILFCLQWCSYKYACYLCLLLPQCNLWQ